MYGRFARDERGVSAVLVALCGGALAGIAAMAIDAGSLFVAARRNQATADLAALAAARNLPMARQAAESTAADNLRSPTVRVERGVYDPNPEMTPETRFRPAATGTAVRVEVRTDTPLYFGRFLMGRDSVSITRQATAAVRPVAAYSIGSRLAALNGGAANAVLSALTGSQVNLSVMDYQALADADVSLAKYLQALETELNLQAGTFDQTLDHQVRAGQALNALNRVLADNGHGTEAAIVARIGRATRSDRVLNLNALVGVDDGLGVRGVNVQMDAMGLTQAVLTTANQNRQLALSFDQNLGVAAMQADLAIGERPNHSPWLSVRRDGATVRTAQTRLYARATLGAPGLLAVQAPLFVELASAEARLGAMNCDQGSVDLDVSPSIGQIALGAVDMRGFDRFAEPLQPHAGDLLQTPVAQVSAFSQVRLGGATAQRVRFNAADIAEQRMRTVTSNDVARTSVASLLASTQIDVRLLGLNLGVSTAVLTDQVRAALTALGAPLDQLLGAVTSLTGVRLGQADVTVHGLRCDAPALVG